MATPRARIPDAVKGGLRPSPKLTWWRKDSKPLTPEDLDGATLSGTITREDGTERPIAGTLSPVEGEAGVFVWDYVPADVAEAGDFEVRITAAFTAPPTPAKTFAAPWKVVK